MLDDMISWERWFDGHLPWKTAMVMTLTSRLSRVCRDERDDKEIEGERCITRERLRDMV